MVKYGVAVAGQVDVGFDGVSALFECQPQGIEGVLGRVPRGAPVCQHHRLPGEIRVLSQA